MAKKMSRRMVALSASAIAAVYFTGYLTTQPADARLSAGATAAAATSTVVPTVRGVATATSAAPAATAVASPTSAGSVLTAPAARSSGYRDGTYQGSGTSRRGGIGVTLTIQGGRIANVAITSVSTQYPVSRIAALPGQVVARQSAQVDRVTGATYSTMAFQQAVQQALANAAAGNGS